ncbi:MAG: hypothetical protein K2K60_02605 [Clostridia bacterium]|nr:hypothetical protein [Clostridia bacterium]
MAKRSTTTVRQRHSITEICAFWGMTIAALFYIFSGFINFLIRVIKSLNGTKTAATLSQICSIFTLLGNIAIIIAIALPAWGFVKYKGKGWKVFYWIMLAVFAFGVVLGMLGSIL